jgi:hypothetical protein
MIEYHKPTCEIIIAELKDENLIIGNPQDILDILVEIGSSGCNRIIINKKNLHKDFFILRTGLAGEILQKFSNYRMKLAITGDFSGITNKSMQDFIRESNRGNMIFFVENMETALIKLGK